jgi:hypothetical protein
MIYFQTKNPNLGQFISALERKMLVPIFYDHLKYFTAIGYNLWPFGLFCGHLVHVSDFGKFGPKKCGNLEGVSPERDDGCQIRDFGLFKVPETGYPGSSASVDGCRVARWFIFIPKIPVWVHFGGSWNRKCWYILSTFGIFYGH